jgi:hypothetical protein
MQEVCIQGTSIHQVLGMVIAGFARPPDIHEGNHNKLTDKEYRHYVAKGQSEYCRLMK